MTQEEINNFHLGAMIQLAEYLDQLIKIGRTLSADEININPMPQLEAQVTSTWVQQKIKKLVRQEVAESSITKDQISVSTYVPQKLYTDSVRPKSVVMKADSIRLETTTQSVIQSKKQTQIEPSKDLMELFTTVKKICLKDTLHYFVNYPSDNIVKGYHNLVPIPLCFQNVTLRLYANMVADQTPQIYDVNEPNILLRIETADYGSLKKHTEKITIEQFEKDKRKFAENPLSFTEQLYKQLRDKPKPYQYVTEIVRDFVIIFANAWFWNYQSPIILTSLQDAFRDLHDRFTSCYSESVWPQWAEYLNYKHIKPSDKWLDKIKRLIEWQKQAKIQPNFDPDEMKVKQVEEPAISGVTSGLTQTTKSYQKDLDVRELVVVKQEQFAHQQDNILQPPIQQFNDFDSLPRNDKIIKIQRIINQLTDQQKNSDEIQDITGGDAIENVADNALPGLFKVLISILERGCE